MSRLGQNGRADGWIARLAPALGVAILVGLGLAPARAQGPAPAAAPGLATVEPGAPGLPPEIQIVRFHGPEGVRLEVLGPKPDAVDLGDGHGLATVGLRVGVGYRLRIWNLPGRPEAELYPVVEIVGHLHRPEGIDPARFPIRVSFGETDLIDAVDRGRLVTQVVYLEDPEHALPIALPKDEIPIVTINATEDPLRVAAALGRVMAIVRMGGRKPTIDEVNNPTGAAPSVPLGPSRCPFVGPNNGPCALPCGPVRGTPPQAGRPWMPRDEFLCDGGDHGDPIHFSGDGALSGIDPRDALIVFNDTKRPRVLPTNMVCIYAPRFAEVRASVGPNQALNVQGPVGMEKAERDAAAVGRLNSKRLVQNTAAQANRHRARPSGMKGRVYAGEHAELRVLGGYDTTVHIAGDIMVAGVAQQRTRLKAAANVERLRAIGIKTGESAVATGIIEGAGETVVAWPAYETVGVEEPPKRPGLAVIKRVSEGQAEAGAVLAFVIQYRNMGNTPIRTVSIIDSLLPRLEYVSGSARAVQGTIFSTAENHAGSTELRWDLPGAIPPGGEGYVSFQAVVR